MVCVGHSLSAPCAFGASPPLLKLVVGVKPLRIMVLDLVADRPLDVRRRHAGPIYGFPEASVAEEAIGCRRNRGGRRQ